MTNRNYHYILNINNTKGDADKPTYDPPTLVELILAQRIDVSCRIAAAQVGRASSEFSINSNTLIVRRSIVDGAIQIAVAPLTRKYILMVSRHPPIAWYPGYRRVYDTLGHNFYWLQMVADVDQIESICSSWPRKDPKYSHQNKLHLFHASGSHDSVAMDILDPPPKTTQCSQCKLVIIDQYFKLTWRIPSSKRITTHIANIFFDHWLIPYGNPT